MGCVWLSVSRRLIIHEPLKEINRITGRFVYCLPQEMIRRHFEVVVRRTEPSLARFSESNLFSGASRRDEAPEVKNGTKEKPT